MVTPESQELRRDAGCDHYTLRNTPYIAAIGDVGYILFMDESPSIGKVRSEAGSDAIAGVRNLLLKDASSACSVELRTGGYTAGDGDAGSVAVPWTASGVPRGDERRRRARFARHDPSRGIRRRRPRQRRVRPGDRRAVHTSMCSNHINMFGDEDQKRRWLGPLARGEKIGAVGSPQRGSEGSRQVR